MEIVVLNSDIARLVLGYLKNQRLERASRVFCKTSPHLRQEFSAYKQGLQTHSFFPELQEIICEHVKISRKVDQLLLALPDNLRIQLQQKKLSDKVIELLERALQTILGHGSSNIAGAKSDSKSNPSSTCTSLHSDKENKSRRTSERKCKRKRNSRHSSPDDPRNASQFGRTKKRRRELEPFCFLGAKGLNLNFKKSIENSFSCGESVSSQSDDMSGSEEDEADVDDEADEIDEHDGDISLLERPTKESTPHRLPGGKFQPPSLPEISQAILENPEFQIRLVQNINQALSTNNGPAALNGNANSVKPPQTAVGDADAENACLSKAVASEEDDIIYSNQMLDEMVKKILEATEKDPAFDAIIEEVVGVSNRSQFSAGAQCNIMPSNGGDPATANFQLNSTANGNPLMVNAAATNLTTIPPRTPHIIRNAVAATTMDGHAVPTLNTNTSFGSLIDPNFSISKLIVLNSNESAQKHLPEHTMGNTTTDNLINQLTAGPIADDQVCFDATTGQLTFPLFLTSDGLLANFPFLSNNDVVTQHLQADNIANLESSRIEIPLPEPIVVTADQLPPNSIILGSAQKVIPEEEGPPQQLLQQDLQPPAQQEAAELAERTVSKLQKDSAVVPSSLDSRMNAERVTPSTSGIVNVKAYRSLSTPRKRTSHVRTLTFSPRTSLGLAKSTAGGATPLSTRQATNSRLLRIQKTIPEVENSEVIVSERPIIKNVEILPRLAAATIDATTNDSSNSCNVPLLFVAEEGSNQTVIEKAKSGGVAKLLKTASGVGGGGRGGVDTPKRRQLRKNAVKACKRQLSKSPNEEDRQEEEDKQKDSKSNVENQENILVEDKEKQKAAAAQEEKDRMMAEWQRMRNASYSDLDSRLRELNAKMGNTLPSRRDVRKRGRRKKVNTALVAKKKRKSKVAAANLSHLQVEDEVLNGEECEIEPTAEVEAIAPVDVQSEDELNDAPTLNNEEASEVVADAENKVSDEVKLQEVATATVTTPSTVATAVTSGGRKKRASKDKQKEFSIKIPTPQKPKEKCDDVKLDHSPEKAKSKKAVDTSGDSDFQVPANSSQTAAHTDEFEREKRTANIACLLETPFKEASLCSNFVPPTPGIFAPTLDTPHSKKQIAEEVMHSSSFLFGSLTKSELDTPMLSAITPGFRFTPFAAKDATPRSVAATEYSSGGGSYYKPDESDDLDRNFDKLMRDSAQKKRTDDEQQQQQQQQQEEEEKRQRQTREHSECHLKEKTHESSQFAVVSTAASGASDYDAKPDAICVEIPAEELKVEPIVLKRVKSFGTDALDGDETSAPSAKIDPHYTLASGLPDISAEEESSSSSSSSSSAASTVSSTSSSSSSSSSSNSTTSSSSSSTAASKTVVSAKSGSKTPQKSHSLALSLDNLSEISSTEDAEWQKLVVTDAEDSQLVGDDGEVRYPVRSWLTPSKEQAMNSKPTTMMVTLPYKSTEKVTRQVNELEMKRERMKEKLKRDCQPTKTRTSVSAATTRKIQTIRDKAKKPASPSATATSGAVAIPPLPLPVAVVAPVVDNVRTIDVLTALNLSARKQQSHDVTALNLPTMGESRRAPLLGDIDDNAVSNIFGSAAETSTTMTAKSQDSVPLKTLLSAANSGQRKCLQIDALPAVTRAATAANRRKVGRKPRAGAAKASNKEAASLNVTPPQAAEDSLPVANLSPTAKFKITHSGGSGSGSSVRVSSRLNKGKKVSGNLGKIGKAKAAAMNKMGNKLDTSTKAMTPHKRTLSKKQKEQHLKKINDMKELVVSIGAGEKKPEVDEVEMVAESTEKPKTRGIAKKKTKQAEPHVNKEHEKEQETEKAKDIEPEREKQTEKEELKLKERQEKVPESHRISTPTGEAKEDCAANVAPNDCVARSDDVRESNGCLDDTSEDDDPLDGCALTSITEDDAKHFISVVYSGPAEPPKQPSRRHSFTNFKMVVAIDDDEKHTWRVTDELVLFDCAPAPRSSERAQASTSTALLSETPIQGIRNIPKKRKTRITAISPCRETVGEAMQPSDTVSTSTSRLCTDIEATPPTATSTPLQTSAVPATNKLPKEQRKSKSTNPPTTTITTTASAAKEPTQSNIHTAQLSDKETPQTVADEYTSNSAATSLSVLATVAASAATESAEKIQIEDIESILSHLHGT